MHCLCLRFQNDIGIVDTTSLPGLQASEFIKKTGYFSTVCQDLVDHCTGAIWKSPWRVKTQLIFFNEKDARFTLRTAININNILHSLFILGDMSHPLLPWIMKPFTRHPNSRKESFNSQATALWNIHLRD